MASSREKLEKKNILTVGEEMRKKILVETPQLELQYCSCLQKDGKICQCARPSVSNDQSCTSTSSTLKAHHSSLSKEHGSPEHSLCSDSATSLNKSLSSYTVSLNSSESTSENPASKSLHGVSMNSKNSLADLPKLSMPIRNQYHKLDSQSIAEQTSQTTSSTAPKYPWKLLHSNQSTFESFSAGNTFLDQSISQLSSNMSSTLTPTPLQPLPYSCTDLSSSSQLTSPLSPIAPVISSPPLSPITPITNSITPENMAIRKAKSKKSIEKAAGPSQYIFMAAHQISEAQEHEKRNELAEAVIKYREGVGTLLQGVQAPGTVQPVATQGYASNSNCSYKGEDEANVARREGVRRKTAQYLQRAEQLLFRLTRQASNITSALTNQPLMPDKECMSGLGICGLQCDTDLLLQYRVLGMAGTSSCPAGVSSGSLQHNGVIVAQLPQSKHTVAIKVIVKSSNGRQGKSLIPRGVPHMVPVVCYHETDSAIYLVMKYISGGRLWDHISKYVCEDCHVSSSNTRRSNGTRCPSPQSAHMTADFDEGTNIYSGRRFLMDDNCLDANINMAAAVKSSCGKAAAAVGKLFEAPAIITQVKTSEKIVAVATDEETTSSTANVKNEVPSIGRSELGLRKDDIDLPPTKERLAAQNVMQYKYQKKKLSLDEITLQRKASTLAPMQQKGKSLDVVQHHTVKDKIDSPSVGDTWMGCENTSQVDDTREDMSTVDENETSRIISSQFTSADSDLLVARSGMAHYQPIDSSSCASNTSTLAPDWGEKTATGTGTLQEDPIFQVSGPKSERLEGCRGCGVGVRSSKTSPISGRELSEVNLCTDLEFFPAHFVSKSVSAEDLTLHSMSALEDVNIQHSTISTVNVVPLLPKIFCKIDGEHEGAVNNVEKDDNVSIGSDTLSGVSDDFSCSMSINHLSEDRKKSTGVISTTTGTTNTTSNLLSECAISEGRKRPCNTPDSAFAFMHHSECALMSLCQSTSADITSLETTLEPSRATLNNSNFSVTLNANGGSASAAPAVAVLCDAKVKTLVSTGQIVTDVSKSNASSLSGCSMRENVVTETSSLSFKCSKKLQKSNSDDLSAEKNDKKPDDERCPSEPASISSVTLPSFSTSQLGDRSGSEAASFDIEELIRNSRRLLQNVDMTLEQSKSKGVKPVASEDSSTSIDQSELPLDSVSVGFDTPDVPSNSTRCSHVSSERQAHSKQMADNTYSSIPSIALDTSRHAVAPDPTNLTIDHSASSMDKAMRSPRQVAKNTISQDDTSVTDAYQSCKESHSSKDSGRNDKNAALLVPRESMTSKEDSTNPSDIHTQIHCSATAEKVPEEVADLKVKAAILSRQANFEKSDTSHSSLQNGVKKTALVEFMMAYGGMKGNDESASASNDSTSMSGLTLNNSDSSGVTPGDKFAGDGSSTHSLNSNEKLSPSRSNGEDVSSESTSGLEYCRHPDPIVNDGDEHCSETIVRARNLSNVHLEKSRVQNKPEEALSEPLYLLPQKDRVEIMSVGELTNKDKGDKSNSLGRKNLCKAGISALDGEKLQCKLRISGNDGLIKESSVSSPVSACVAHETFVATSITESMSLHTCKSRLSAGAKYGSQACDSESTMSNNRRSDLSNATDRSANSTCIDSRGENSLADGSLIDSTSTSFVNHRVGSDICPRSEDPHKTQLTDVTDDEHLIKSPLRACVHPASLPHQQSSLTTVSEFNERESPKKFSIIHQTPLSGLLETYWLTARQKSGQRDPGLAGEDKRHLPEGLVKVWGAQMVTAISALHDVGIIWGDFGPRNVLLEDGGSVILTLETRWSSVEVSRPAAGHCSVRCRSTTCRPQPCSGRDNAFSQACEANIKNSELRSIEGGSAAIDPTHSMEKVLTNNTCSTKPASVGPRVSKVTKFIDCTSTESKKSTEETNENMEGSCMNLTVAHKQEEALKEDGNPCTRARIDYNATKASQSPGSNIYHLSGEHASNQQSSECCGNDDQATSRQDSYHCRKSSAWSCDHVLCHACLGYVAPELSSPLSVPSPASDWWSFGALIYHLLTGCSVAGQHPSGVTSHTELVLPPHLSPEASLLLSQLLTAHPAERLGGGPTGAQEIRIHPFFTEAPWPN